MNKKLYSMIYSPKIILAHSGLPTDFENEVLVSHFRQNTKYKKLSHQTTTTVMVKLIQKRSFNNKKDIDFPSPAEKANQIPGVFFWHILYKATSEKTERVMTIRVMTIGKITSAKEGEHNFGCCL